MSANQQNNNSIAGAVTFPSRNADTQPVPVQPRQPRNLQGLLRFAMEATKAEDAPGNSDFTPMDEERRKFLEEALKSLTVDMAQVIRDAIKVLSDAEKMRNIQLGESLPEDVQKAFDNLLELIDDIDIANDFYKMGGFAIFPVCFGSENDTVRARASAVLGEACQNNPFCQERALETGLLNVVLSLVQSESGEALAKGIYALSCVCREYEPACGALVSQGGCEVLSALLQAEEPAARTKAAFLIRYLCHNYPDAREKFIEQNIVRDIGTIIKNGRDSTTEHFLSVVLALLPDPTVTQQCTDPDLNLKKILEDHLKHPDLRDDSFTEEKEYAEELLNIVASYPQVERVHEEVDR